MVLQNKQQMRTLLWRFIPSFSKPNDLIKQLFYSILSDFQGRGLTNFYQQKNEWQGKY